MNTKTNIQHMQVAKSIDKHWVGLLLLSIRM